MTQRHDIAALTATRDELRLLLLGKADWVERAQAGKIKRPAHEVERAKAALAALGHAGEVIGAMIADAGRAGG